MTSSLSAPPWEFHISRRARERFDIDRNLFGFDGRIIISDVRHARMLADRINATRDLETFPDQAVSAGELTAIAIIDELLHAMLARYRSEIKGDLLEEALHRLETSLGRDETNRILHDFIDQFPPTPVYLGEITIEAYLQGSRDGIPHRQIALEELLFLWLTNSNPATTSFAELFDDSELRARTSYLRCIDVLRGYLVEQPALDNPHSNLLDALRGPAISHPNSAAKQLEFITTFWSASFQIPEVHDRVLTGIDLLAEENKPFFGHGPGPPVVPDYGAIEELDEEGYEEPELIEAYSVDQRWMPRLVLMAKNAHVWLAQLSDRYQRPIHSLDAIPDEELDRLAHWGFTGLWLIGVWERSRASKRIKRMMGDDQAEASAYSLEDYRVAGDLGGEEAFNRLQERAWNRGIRLSTDMVPNHVGIDSTWVINRPEWFIQTDQPPFPSYRFEGPDLCDDARVSIFLEDHYYDRSDAAVVFKRVDNATGDTRYIYHGNDGTSMPWNDTAQLDYRRADVRDAVMETILKVARRSPIIRFDAAMVLTKKNIHRLWFPAPGSGGDIASRTEHSMTKTEFNSVMPHEFWRQVVDTVAAHAPETLLLAEAFWLLEGYFVRSLGMHRVYNSAFMNMLCSELNNEYRQLIKNTLEFDPEILKRYVNFMSNPDEKTAIDQFGDGDKYFGVTTLLVTMPGLPMFGHGQVEGLYEKYGMEFIRPRWDEQPNTGLIARHEHQVFDLIRQRELFAEVDHFQLYDLECEDGSVNENVFAYSNRFGDRRALIIYNNSSHPARGRVKNSVAKLVADDHGGKSLHRVQLANELGLAESRHDFLRTRNSATRHEHLYALQDLRDIGLPVQLEAYELRVFLDFESFTPEDRTHWAKLDDELKGAPCDDLDTRILDLELESFHRAFVNVATLIIDFSDHNTPADKDDNDDDPSQAFADELEGRFARVFEVLAIEFDIDGIAWTPDHIQSFDPSLFEGATLPARTSPEDDHDEVDDDARNRDAWITSLVGLFAAVRLFRQSLPKSEREDFFEKWRLSSALSRAFRAAGHDQYGADRSALIIRLMLEFEDLARGDFAELEGLPELLVDSPRARDYLGIHEHAGHLWFRREPFEEMLDWLARLRIFLHESRPELVDDADTGGIQDEAMLKESERTERPEQLALEDSDPIARLTRALELSGFTIEGLKSALDTHRHPEISAGKQDL